MGRRKSSVSAHANEKPQHLDHLTPCPVRRSSVISNISMSDDDDDLQMDTSNHNPDLMNQDNDLKKTISSKMVIAEPSVKKFDDLNSFEQFIKDETWDNDYDYYHVQVSYLPPFILSEIHNNLEKIKPTMNSRSKKFVRHLNHHIKRHLIQEINYNSGVDYKFDKPEVEHLNDGRIIFHFKDYSNHGFNENEYDSIKRTHWKIDLNIETNPENPYVNVDLKSLPVLD